jgi:hypothetical protein
LAINYVSFLRNRLQRYCFFAKLPNIFEKL